MASDFLINIGCCVLTGCCKPADRGMDALRGGRRGAAGGCEPADRDMDSGYGRHTPHRSETCTCVTRSRSRRPGKRSIRIFCTGTRGRNVNLTGMQPLQRAAAHGALYDMEAAAVYQAGIRFFLRTGCFF